MALTPKGVSVQSLYQDYRTGKLVVNRRYQRKLVWNLDEKRELIESILHDFPIPLLLFAESKDKQEVEIVDGLQRLNAIFTFIETRYQVQNGFFNLETFLSAKRANSNGEFDKGYSDENECIPEDDCEKILNYNLAVTTFQATDSTTIDLVFNRINATGVKLSEQDRRQAGATSVFSDLVSRLASYVRGDVSKSIVPLVDMGNISIANRANSTGPEIVSEEIFWCKNGILHAKKLKNSGDEEVVADILAGMILEKPNGVGKDNLDKLYDTASKVSEDIDYKIRLMGEQHYYDRFIKCFEEVEALISSGTTKFSQHVYSGVTNNEQTQIFYAVFLAIHSLLFEQSKKLSDTQGAWQAITSISPKMNIGQEAQNPDKRLENIRVIKGLLDPYCADFKFSSEGSVNSQTKFKSILSLSKIENKRIEYKQGVVNLQSKQLDDAVLKKIPKLIVSLANSNPSEDSYLIFGVCDGEKDRQFIENQFGTKIYNYMGWNICGVNKDLECMNWDLEKLFNKIKTTIENSELSDAVKRDSISGLAVFSYEVLDILAVTIPPQKSPAFLGDDCYARSGNDIKKLSNREVSELTKIFAT